MVRHVSRFRSVFALALALFWHFVRLPFRRRKDNWRQVLENYAGERLFALTAAHRRELPSFDRCIGCGLCDTGCPSLQGAPRHLSGGPAALAMAARSTVDFVRWRDFVRLQNPCADCQACESICPTRVPLRALVQWVRYESERSE